MNTRITKLAWRWVLGAATLLGLAACEPVAVCTDPGNPACHPGHVKIQDQPEYELWNLWQLTNDPIVDSGMQVNRLVSNADWQAYSQIDPLLVNLETKGGRPTVGEDRIALVLSWMGPSDAPLLIESVDRVGYFTPGQQSHISTDFNVNYSLLQDCQQPIQPDWVAHRRLLVLPKLPESESPVINIQLSEQGNCRQPISHRVETKIVNDFNQWWRQGQTQPLPAQQSFHSQEELDQWLQTHTFLSPPQPVDFSRETLWFVGDLNQGGNGANRLHFLGLHEVAGKTWLLEERSQSTPGPCSVTTDIAPALMYWLVFEGQPEIHRQRQRSYKQYHQCDFTAP